MKTLFPKLAAASVLALTIFALPAQAADDKGELLGNADESDRERRRKATDRLLGYFAKHTGRLNYAERLQAGRAIGSGQVEGEAKTLGLRLKRRGARWDKKNVQPMASLVCVRHTCQWDAYWAMAV